MIAAVPAPGGHAAQARRMGFRPGELDHQFDALLLVCGITLTAMLSLVLPDPALHGALLVLLALLSAKWSFQVSRGAAEAMRLLHLAPTRAPRDWLQGWTQHQALQALALGGIGSLAIAWRAGPWSLALLAPGTVLLAQAFAAWWALAARRQAHLGWWLLPPAAAWLAWHGRGSLPAAPAPTLWLGSALAASALGLTLLAAAHARLQRIQRLGRRQLSPAWDLLGWADRGWPALRARVSPPTLTGAPWWEGSRALFLWSLLLLPGGDPASIGWGAPVGPLYLLSWLLWAQILMFTLRSRQVHWRRALAPGGGLRQSLGWHMLANCLKVQAAAWLLGLLLSSLWQWAWHKPVLTPVANFLAVWPCWLELLFVSALAVALAGRLRHIATHWLHRSAIATFVAGMAWAISLGFRGLRDPVWGHVEAGHLALLLLGTVALLPLCRHSWAQVDLHELMRASVRRNGQEGVA